MSKALFVAAMAVFFTATVKAQQEKQDTPEGNGNLVIREVPVSSFSTLSASGVFELKLSQGSKEAVKVEAEESLQSTFEVRTEGNRLVIAQKEQKNKSPRLKSKMRVYVTFRNLTALDLSTVGSVNGDKELSFDNVEIKNASVGKVDLNLKADKVSLKNSSVGTVKLTGKAQNADVSNSGVGTLDAGDFVVQTMNIENSGVGKATVNAEKELKVKDNMLGRVKNKGTAPVRKNNRVTI